MTVLGRVANVAKETTLSKNLGPFSVDRGKEGSQGGGHVDVQVFALLADGVLPHSFSVPDTNVGLSF